MSNSQRYRRIGDGRDEIVEAEQFDRNRPWPEGVRWLEVTNQYYLDGPSGHLHWIRPGDWVVTPPSPYKRYPLSNQVFRLTYEPLDAPDEPVEQADDVAAAVGALAAEVRALREALGKFLDSDESREYLDLDTNDSISNARYVVTVLPRGIRAGSVRADESGSAR